MNIKRFFSLFLAFSTLFIMCFSASAANLGSIGGVTAQDLKFTPDGGGKFIYVNNNEGILRTHLTDTSNSAPEYIMKNTEMTPNRYSMYLSFINRTETRFETTNVIDEQGFDIEVDVELKAEKDSVFKINAIGFEVTDYDVFFKDGVLTKKDRPWSCLQAVADFTQRPVFEQSASAKYFPCAFEAKEVSVKKGNTVWLSEFIENYRPVPWLKGVQLLADVEIISGSAEINVAALRSDAKVGDRSRHNPDAAPGKYYRDRQYKGIADTLPSVSSNVLSYKIDDYFVGGTYLPVTVYNQYQPSGNTLTKWFTNLNPQEDIWSRDLCAESDMLSFKYIDDSKLDYYGQFIKENKKDNVWLFDVYHSDTTNWDGADITGYKKSEYIPNYPLTTERENSGYGCNLGNYGVATNYRLKIENTSGTTRYFNYHLKTTSDNIVNVKDKNGNYINDYAVTKGQSDTKLMETLACVPLLPNQTTEFTIEVTLPTNCAGGMENSFSVTDTETKIEFTKSETYPYLKEKNFTGTEYYKWEDGKLYTSPDNENFSEKKLDAKTTELFKNKWNDYEIRRAGKGYTARCSAYLDAPSLYSETLKYFNGIYILDENFNVTAQKQFDAFPVDVSYAFGKYYVTTRTGSFCSADGVNWKSFLSGFSVPVAPEADSKYAVAYKDKTMYVTLDGESFVPVKFSGNAPKYIDTIGKYFCYADGNKLYIAENPLFWSEIVFDGEITSIDLINGKIVINKTNTVSVPEIKNDISLCLNDTFVVPDASPVIESDRTLVPVRAVLEELGAHVDFNTSSRTVTASLGAKNVTLGIDGEIAYVNNTAYTLDAPPKIISDRTFVPIRFIAEALGLKVTWNEEQRIITVSNQNENTPSKESILPAFIPNGGMIPTENAATAVAKAVIAGLNLPEAPLSATLSENGEAWNITDANGEIILVLSKNDGRVLDFKMPVLD